MKLKLDIEFAALELTPENDAEIHQLAAFKKDLDRAGQTCTFEFYHDRVTTLTKMDCLSIQLPK